jgi:predicted phage baseplate assembly protein
MPLEAPNLDTRTADQLYEELRRRIPRYTPEWTDFNESDPGIALLQLFAWLSEQLFFELNRVPDRSYIKFLQLLGLERRPARPARADLEFTPRPGADVRPVPAGALVAGQPADGGDLVIFETTEGLDLTRVVLGAVQVWDGNTFSVVTAENQSAAGQPFRPLGWSPQLGSALYLGFDPPEAAIPAGPFPDQLRFQVFLPSTSGRSQAQRCEPEGSRLPAPVTLAWEYLPTTQEPPRWQPLSLFRDESAAFTREGNVLVAGPTKIEPTTVGKVDDQARYWLRCRLDRGSYPGGRGPEIDAIRPNVVPAWNLASVRDELVGESTGRPDQVVQLRRRPVAHGSLVLETQLTGADAEAWERHDDLLDARPDDRRYVLNHNRGEIRFGDGRRGQIPPAGAEIIARFYRYGGGQGGNLGADQITTPVTSLIGVDSVSNPRPAVGGEAEQDLEDLKARAPRELRRRSRAVTPEDFTSLAEEVGGVRRAIALPLTHPDHPGVQVPGTVTVIVVPSSQDRPPEPSSDLVREVCAHLEGYRLLTTEVFVRGPAYQAIGVEANVAAGPYATFGQVEQQVLKRLDEALDPYRYTFGADFSPTSLYSVLLSAPDLVSVESLKVTVGGVPHELTERVVVPAGGLLYGVGHDICVTPARDL